MLKVSYCKKMQVYKRHSSWYVVETSCLILSNCRKQQGLNLQSLMCVSTNKKISEQNPQRPNSYSVPHIDHVMRNVNMTQSSKI